MIYIKNESKDPYFNQAFEEYVFEHFTLSEDILLLWINDPCLVCGRYQNVFQEVNVSRAGERRIPIIRRNTGGGTVYHDRGNLNYTIMKPRESGAPLDYDVFLKPVIEALGSMGIPAYKRNICDIAIQNWKISGSAQSVKANKVLHHGTLLFDADLKTLKDLLTPVPGKMISKAIPSVPSPVTNIKEHFTGQSDMNIEKFKERFKEALLGKNGMEFRPDAQVLDQVEKLSREKYRTWTWNIGKGPKFIFYPENTQLYLCVEKGIVVQCSQAKFEGLPADIVLKEIYET